MLMLAVAAGESGGSPELSRNGVLVRFRVPASPKTCRTAHPAVRSGCRCRPGLVEWARGRVRSRVPSSPASRPYPLPSARLRAERGRAS
ncbi:redoxin [Streptomyces albidoflavus]|nr:redoxin [Streptomyces albidoflavus]